MFSIDVVNYLYKLTNAVFKSQNSLCTVLRNGGTTSTSSNIFKKQRVTPLNSSTNQN